MLHFYLFNVVVCGCWRESDGLWFLIRFCKKIFEILLTKVEKFGILFEAIRYCAFFALKNCGIA